MLVVAAVWLYLWYWTSAWFRNFTQLFHTCNTALHPIPTHRDQPPTRRTGPLHHPLILPHRRQVVMPYIAQRQYRGPYYVARVVGVCYGCCVDVVGADVGLADEGWEGVGEWVGGDGEELAGGVAGVDLCYLLFGQHGDSTAEVV